MSYRNPQIITPPNYGEIFARNMQYGAALVNSLTKPLMDKIEAQRESVKYGAKIGFQQETNIDKTVETGNIGLDEIVENAYGLKATDIANMAAASQRRGGPTELDVSRAANKDIKEATRISNGLKGVVGIIEKLTPEERRQLSLTQSVKQTGLLGLAEALSDLDNSGFSMVEDPESGIMKISYIKQFDKLKKGQKGEYVSYTIEDIEALIEAGYEKQENFATSAEKGGLPTMFNTLTNANKIIVGDADTLNVRQKYGLFSNKGLTPSTFRAETYGEERDANGMLIDNGLRDANGGGYGQNKQTITTSTITGFDNYKKDYRKVINLDLNNTKLDKIFDDKFVGRVNPDTDPIITAPDGSKVKITSNSIVVARKIAAQYGLANSDKDIEHLALQITSGRNTKDEEGNYNIKVTSVRDSSINNSIRTEIIQKGQEFNLAELIHEFTLDELTELGTTSAVYNPSIKGYNFTGDQGTLIEPSTVGPGKKPPTVKDGKDPSRTDLQFAQARYNRLTTTRDTIDRFETLAYTSENASDSGKMLLNLSKDKFKDTEQYLSENFGLKMSRATEKDPETGNYPRRDYRVGEDGNLFGIFKFESNSIAKDSKGVSFEMTLKDGKTSLFDIYERILSLENTKDPDGSAITAAELENMYSKGSEDFDQFISELTKEYRLREKLGIN